MRKLISLVLLLVCLVSIVYANDTVVSVSWNVLQNTSNTVEGCNYFVGDNPFDLPRIISNRVYDNSPSHKIYLACVYSFNGKNGFEEMNSTQNCREQTQIFTPTTEGTYNYNLAVIYRERQWNQAEHQWVTVSEGVDNSLNTTFTVCDIPNDNNGWNDFINWINNLFCVWFGWFC